MKSSEIAALPIETRRQMAIRERLKGLSDVDVVKAWYESEDPFDLTEGEDQIRTRWDYAKAQFLKRKLYTQVRDAIMAEFGVSVSQARTDIRNMRYAFGPLDEVPKVAHRQLAIKMALQAFDVAKAAKDSDGMSKATKAYISASGIDREDSEPFDLDKLMKDRTYVEVIDPSLRTLLLNLLAQSGGVLDTSKIFERVTAVKSEEGFVDYEMVQNDANP